MVDPSQDSLLTLSRIRHIFLILSGKGGVGKSSVTTQTALALCHLGYKVGVLDIDLTGPSLPRMFGLEGKNILQSTQGWTPVSIPVPDGVKGSLQVISLGFLLDDRGNSVVWRGPKKASMIKQFISNVAWGELDYLLIDTPPGTSDEHISIAEQLRWSNPDGAIIVTTPQSVATADVKKEINFCRKVELNILGLVENMSGFICPYCAECTNIFSSGGGEKLARSYSIPYLGAIPIDPKFVELIESQSTSGEYLVQSYHNSAMFSVFEQVLLKLLENQGPSRC